MKNFAIAILATVFLASCGNSKRVVKEKVYVPAPTAVSIQNPTPYQEGHRIKRNIIDECIIDQQMAEFTKQFGEQNGVNVTLVSTLNTGDAGATLKIEIADAVSSGNAFIGHRKYTKVVGTLYQDGVEAASFQAARNSGGGAFAGFKGSCAVLGRTVEALGKDVAGWLKAPWKDAYLGDF